MGGGGAFGPDLSQEKERFTNNTSGSGVEQQIQFVTQGSIANAPYGNNGVGTGRMPGFAKMLTKSEIEKIVSYERYCLDTSTFLKVEPVCITDTKGRVEPTSTTAAKG
jgi:mono/diheme cytochrome c family protein